MSYPKVSDEEITRRGKELYEKSIRTQVETPENIGKIISINVETGEYEIGDDLVVTSLRLRAKQADLVSLSPCLLIPSPARLLQTFTICILGVNHLRNFRRFFTNMKRSHMFFD